MCGTILLIMRTFHDFVYQCIPGASQFYLKDQFAFLGFCSEKKGNVLVTPPILFVNCPGSRVLSSVPGHCSSGYQSAIKSSALCQWLSGTKLVLCPNKNMCFNSRRQTGEGVGQKRIAFYSKSASYCVTLVFGQDVVCQKQIG